MLALGYKFMALLLMLVVLAGMSLVVIPGGLLMPRPHEPKPSPMVLLAMLVLFGVPQAVTWWLWRTLRRRPPEWSMLSLGRGGWLGLVYASYGIGCVCGVLFIAEII